MVNNLPAMQETQEIRVRSVGQADSQKWQPPAVFLARKFHGQRSLADSSLWDHRELDTAKQLSTNKYIVLESHSG